MAELTQIPLNCLTEGRWYVGRGRNSNVGFWDGKFFLVIGFKIDSWRIKREPYYTNESGCFQPFLMIDEGQVLKTMGGKRLGCSLRAKNGISRGDIGNN